MPFLCVCCCSSHCLQNYIVHVRFVVEVTFNSYCNNVSLLNVFVCISVGQTASALEG